MKHQQPPGETTLPAPPSDAEVIEEYRDFFRKEYRSVVRFLLLIGASWEEAEDAAQEAMAVAYGRWSAIEYPAQWVRKVARRCHVKSAQRDRRRPEIEAQVARIPQTEPDEYERLIVGHEWVLEVLRGLPPRQREILAWSLDGYQPKEIGYFLSKKPETVRSNLRAALNKVRLSLQPTALRQRKSYESPGEGGPSDRQA